MPFTSSVLPVPRSPSRAMTSPASTTSPRRRPRARVSSVDAVSTKVFVAGPFHLFEPLAIPQPNARPAFDLSDHGQGEADTLEDAPGSDDPAGRGRADQLEVLGIFHGQRPFLRRQASRKWK